MTQPPHTEPERHDAPRAPGRCQPPGPPRGGRRLLVAVVVGCWLAVVAGVGCGAAEERPDRAPARVTNPTSEGTFTRLELRALHHWSPPRGEPESRLELWGLFVQHVGLDASVTRTHLGIPAEALPLEPGQCRPLDPPAPPAAPVAEMEEVAVELLDAGALYVVVPGQSTLVRPALYPDVLPHVSGVQYRATLSTAEEGLSLRQVSLQGFGGRDVGTFELMRRSGPADFRIVQVAGSPPGETPFAVRVGMPLWLRWSPVNTEAQVRVRLRWGARSGGRPGGLECRPRRRGVFRFRASDLAPARPGPNGLDATVRVVASNQETFRLPDGTPGALRLSQSDAVTLTLSP